ncbi:MAG: hypothetical protein ABSA09_00620 [Desulfobaccales bacterium]|jgi:hypothetical protein
MKRQAGDTHKTFSQTLAEKWGINEDDVPLFLGGLLWIIFNLILLGINLSAH